MERRGQAPEDKVCHTCGHTGFADSIATCSLCRVSHEHTYCMSFVRYEVPKGWLCEECSRSTEAASNRHLPAPVPQFWRKRTSRKIEAGKVKFITNEEVVTLASGKRPHGRGNLSVSGHRSDFTYAKPLPVSWNRVAPTFPSSKAVQDLLRPKKGPVYTGVEISPSEHNKTSKPAEEKGSDTAAQVRKMKTVEDSLRADDGRINMVDKHIDNKTPLKFQDECLFIEEPANASLANKEERNLHMQRDANVLPVNDSGTAVLSIPQFKQILSQEVLLPLKLVISSDEKHHHAVEACWRGAFEVQDFLSQFHGTVDAHFPCQVSPKVYDISKHLPGTLQFKMLSRESVWPKIFKLNPPTEDDVALYFRCEVERYKEKYTHFIQHIDSHDYALQGCVEDVELLLFTSSQLQIDSQNLGWDLYLWGVFRHLKRKKGSHGEEEKADLLLRSSSIEKEGDMEIDMVAGCPIGRVDRPIKLEDAPYGLSKPIQRPIQRPNVNLSLKKSTNSHFMGTPPGFPVPAYKRSGPTGN